MKMKTIEQKAKAYDEALNVIKNLVKAGLIYEDAAIQVFPELKESEDERMIKFIKNQLFNIKKTITDNYKLDTELTKAIDWLEKQGEHKPVELKTKAGNWYVCDMEVMNENMATAFHRDEIYYCPKDGYLYVSGALFEVGSLDVFRLATEKEIPQSHWKPSDEPQRIVSAEAKEAMYDKPAPLRTGAIGFDGEPMESKPCEQKPTEWSKEDGQYLLVCKNALAKYQVSDKWDATIISQWLENKLKSLRPQSQWKPSDEQMKILNEVLNFAANHESPHWNDYIFGTLNNFIRQLKKLREE